MIVVKMNYLIDFAYIACYNHIVSDRGTENKTKGYQIGNRSHIFRQTFKILRKRR